MDLFAKQIGAQYVHAFAGRLLLAMAKGLGRASDRIKSAFAQEDAEGMWTLAMVVVQWYAESLSAPEAQIVNTALQGLDVKAVASNLNLFRDQLLPFVQKAHQGQSDAQLAAAGVYFVAVVDQIGLTLLQTALKSGAVLAMQKQILARLPLPDELKADYYRALGAQPKGMAVPPATSPSRAERFDRADFAPRLTRPGSSPQRFQAEALASERSRKDTSAAAASSRPPTPILARSEVTRAYLFTLGWEGDEVDRFLAGPGKKKRA